MKDGKEKLKEKKGTNNKDSDAELIEFVDDLQKKWRMDIAKKAERKKARAEARRQSSPKTKKQRKKAEKRQDDTPPPDVPKLHDMIRDFICFNTEEKTLTLPPVDKKSRVAIHEIAHLYKMKSQVKFVIRPWLHRELSKLGIFFVVFWLVLWFRKAQISCFNTNGTDDAHLKDENTVVPNPEPIHESRGTGEPQCGGAIDGAGAPKPGGRDCWPRCEAHRGGKRWV